MTNENPSLKDVYEQIRLVVNTAATKDELQKMAEKIDERFEKIDERFEKLETKVTKVQSEMVTKEYLDNKLDDVKAEIGGRILRHAEHENKFKHELVSAMKRNSLLNIKELKRLEQTI